ncbi:MAG: branched-chain amino acid ABC transporter permease [candidate division NC10 bacterium]
MILLGQVIGNGLLVGGIYVLAAIGISLLFGVMRIVNFAHGEFIMLGAYAAYWGFALWGLDPILTLPASLLAVAAVAAVVYRLVIEPALEAPRLNQILLTFGVAVTLQNLALLLWQSDYRSVKTWYSSMPLRLGEWSFGAARIGGFVLALGLTLALHLFLRRSETGRGLRAVAQDADAASLMGVDLRRARFLAFVLSAALGGAAGVVTSLIMYTSPFVGFQVLLKAFAVVVLGGMGSVAGGVIGGLTLGLVESLTGQYVPGGTGLAEGISFVLLIAILVVRPQGIFGDEAALH